MGGGDGLLRDCLVMAVGLARDEAALAAWWRAHQGALRLLEPGDLAAVIAAKDARKRALALAA